MPVEVTNWCSSLDSYVAKRCLVCREPWPEFIVEGVGEEAIRCRKYGAPVPPFRMVHSYTMVFDEIRRFGVTVDEKLALEVAGKAREWSQLPRNLKQVPVLVLAKET